MKKFQISSSINPSIIEIESNSIPQALEIYYKTVLNLNYNPHQTDEFLNDLENQLVVHDSIDIESIDSLEFFTTIHNIEPTDLLS